MEPLPKKIKFHHNGANSVLSSAYVESLSHESFSSDVILKIGLEKDEYPCHRLVLAASSDFLASILSTATPGTIPVILLPDLKTSIMEYVLTFLYYGEVSVPATKYPDFVDACTLLQLKGPTDNVELVEIDSEDETETNEDTEITIKEEMMDEEEEITENSLQETPLMKINSSSRERGESSDKKRKRLKEMYVTKAFATPDLKKRARERLLRSIERAYTSLGIHITDRIEQNIKESRLVVQNNILVRAVHVCGVCYSRDAKEAHLRYKIFSAGAGNITFMTDSFKLHLKKKHADVVMVT